MNINFNMASQRRKTATFLTKAPPSLVSDNGLHIYYGDSWLPLISPLRSITFPRALVTQTNTPSVAAAATTTTTDAPNFSRPRETSHHQHLPKLPKVLHKHRAGTTPATTTTTRTTTRKTTKRKTHDTIQVWDGARADQEYGSGLQIRRLAGGMGIAVCGRYTDRPRAGQVRHDAFLAHLVEGRMEDTMLALQAQVEEARRRGLRDLATEICYRDDQTLTQDPGMLWNSQMVGAERRLNDRFICRAEALWGTPRLHPYHVSGEKVGMCVSSLADDRQDRVVSVLNI